VLQHLIDNVSRMALAAGTGMRSSDVYRWARCAAAIFVEGRRCLLGFLEMSPSIGGHSGLYLAAQLADMQVGAVQPLMALLDEHPSAQAAFAATVGVPQELLPWLALVATVLSLAWEAGTRGTQA